VQWLLDLQGSLGLHHLPDQALFQLLVQLGQHLFEPPSVKGWDGGRAWISTTTLLLRQNTAKLLVYGGDPGGLLGRDEALDKLREFQAERAKQTPNEPADPALKRRLQRLERRGRRNPGLPPLVDAAALLSGADWTDPARWIDALARRIYAAPLPPAARQALEDYLRQASPAASPETLQGLVYLMLARPEYQLT
jgi:hypothetical protein